MLMVSDTHFKFFKNLLKRKKKKVSLTSFSLADKSKKLVFLLDKASLSKSVSLTYREVFVILLEKVFLRRIKKILPIGLLFRNLVENSEDTDQYKDSLEFCNFLEEHREELIIFIRKEEVASYVYVLSGREGIKILFSYGTKD